jgi:hypothetical protein
MLRATVESSGNVIHGSQTSTKVYRESRGITYRSHKGEVLRRAGSGSIKIHEVESAKTLLCKCLCY